MPAVASSAPAVVGAGRLAAKLSEAEWPYTPTGSLAAQWFASIAPTRVAAVYVEDSDRALVGSSSARPTPAQMLYSPCRSTRRRRRLRLHGPG